MIAWALNLNVMSFLPSLPSVLQSEQLVFPMYGVNGVATSSIADFVGEIPTNFTVEGLIFVASNAFAPDVPKTPTVIEP
jgi:hypothetical protein